MKKLLDSVQARLSGFVEQRRDLALIFTCRNEDNFLLAKMLEAIDRGETSTDIFWMFAEPFEAPAAYVQSIVETFRTRHAGVSEALVKAGDAPWPSIPEELLGGHLPPVERLRRCLIFARDLLSSSTEGHLVIALCPVRITDADAHAHFIVELLRHELPMPWCHHMRMVVREDVAEPMLSRNWRALLPRTQWYAPDLSQDAIQKALEDEVNDGSIPLPQRLQSLLLLAGMDYAHQRYSDATEKYKILSKYYRATQDLSMYSLVLNAIGEVAERSGHRALARKYYESALTPAIESKATQMLINIGLNLGNFHQTDRRWGEALEYHQGVCTLANASLNAPLKILCLERMGTCAYKLGDPESGGKYWHEATKLARGLDAPEQLKGLLRRLSELYRELGMTKRRSEVEQELASVEKYSIQRGIG